MTNNSSPHTTTPDLDAIKARLEALDKLFPSKVYPHRDAETYYTIIDQWGDSIMTVSPRYLGPADTEQARDALFSAPADLRALMVALDAAQVRIQQLEAALRDIGENYPPGVPDNQLDAVLATLAGVRRVARTALEGNK